MPRFNGIPVESEQPTQPRFGGVPVDAQPIQQPITQPVQPPPEPKSWLETFEEGLGDFGRGVQKSVGDTYYGLNQGASDLIGGMGIDWAKNDANDWRKFNDQRQLNYQQQYGNSNAAKAGEIVGDVGQFALGGELLAPVKLAQEAGMATQIGIGALNGAIGGGIYEGIQPVVGDETRLGNIEQGALYGGVGGGIGAPIGMAINRVSKGASDKISPIALDLYKKAKAMGINIRASQLSDSRILKWLSSVTKDVPFTGASRANKEQLDAFTKQGAKLIGEDADNIGSETISNAKKRFNTKYTNIYKNILVRADPRTVSELNNVLTSAKGNIAKENFKILQNNVNSIIDNMNNGIMSGQKYQDVRDLLKTIEYENIGTSLGRYLGDVRTALQNSAERSLPRNLQGALKETDRLYNNFKTIEKASKGADTMDVKVATQGKLNPATLQSKAGSKYNPTPEMDDLIRIGQLIKDSAPQSGTSPRTLINNLMTGVGGGVGATAAYVNPTASALGLGAGVVGSNALNSRWLGKYVAEGMPKIVQEGAEIVAKQSPRVGAVIGINMRPDQFNAKLYEDIARKRITKAQAADRLDQYLQMQSSTQGIDKTRDLYKKYPQWSELMNN